jgi:zinc protease
MKSFSVKYTILLVSLFGLLAWLSAGCVTPRSVGANPSTGIVGAVDSTNAADAKSGSGGAQATQPSIPQPEASASDGKAIAASSSEASGGKGEQSTPAAKPVGQTPAVPKDGASTAKQAASSQGPSTTTDKSAQAGTPGKAAKPAKGKAASTISPADAAYVSKNLATISTGVLDNGIPVIIKRNSANRVFSIKVVLKGHTAFTPLEKAGIEGITLAAMTRGSAKYSYDNLQALQYATSSSIGGSSGSYDLTSFDLVTLDKYFDTLFDAYADCFLHPGFDGKQFDQVLRSWKIDYQKMMSDPYSRATTKLHAAEFASLPYAADFHGTEASLSSITLADVRAYYADFFAPERMSIVAVGDFEPSSLLAKLNASFGKMAKKGIALPPPPKLVVKGNVIFEEFPASEGLAYLRGDFSLPPLGSADSTALKLGFSMLDDLLFEYVRIRHGACYSVWSQTFDARAPYGTIGIFKTKVPEDVKKYVDEAVDALASGKCIAAGNRENGSIVPIADSIDFYKAKFINGFFSAQETNASIGGQIAASDYIFGDYSYYLKTAERIDAVSPEDIERAVNKYLKNAPIEWIVLGEKDMLDKVDRSQFLQ